LLRLINIHTIWWRWSVACDLLWFFFPFFFLPHHRIDPLDLVLSWFCDLIQSIPCLIIDSPTWFRCRYSATFSSNASPRLDYSPTRFCCMRIKSTPSLMILRLDSVAVVLLCAHSIHPRPNDSPNRFYCHSSICAHRIHRRLVASLTRFCSHYSSTC
jgi:hypothetical protein